MFMVYQQSPDLPVARPVELAKSRYSIEMVAADREDALLVTVSRDGRIYFDTRQIGAEELPSSIREKLKLGARPVVYLKIDARARYRKVGEALDGIRHSGVEKVGIITEQRREGWPATQD
jgi:biopolymer transport protein TolR